MAVSIPKEPIATLRGSFLKRLRQQGACFWGELRYLLSLVRDPDVNRWGRSYVTLNAIHGQSNRGNEMAQPLVSLIEECADKAVQAVVNLGGEVVLSGQFSFDKTADGLI